MQMQHLPLDGSSWCLGGLAIIVLVQRLSCDPSEQLSWEDAQQGPGNIQGLHNGP